MNIKSIIIYTVLLFSTSVLTAFKPYIFENENSNSKRNFIEYLSHFENTSLPFEITFDDFPKIINEGKKIKSLNKENNYLKKSDFIPANSRGLFSRMGPPTLEPVARFYTSEKHVAVVFSSQLPFGETHKSYQMIVYDFKGNIISKNRNGDPGSIIIANYNPYETITCKIDEEGNILKEHFETEWKFNLNEVGYKDNEILSYNKIKKEYSKIKKDGNVDEFQELTLITKA